MITKLLPHNEEAYKKVIDAFKSSNRTCVCHPTGTGKSYLVAAVAESYKKVLVLAPNNFVINQVKGVLTYHNGVEYMTYSALLNADKGFGQYDLIVLDEFHRAGAPEWEKSVRALLEANYDAKVLGTTATPIRYLDRSRNMAEEIFHNNIASEMSVGEAFESGILPIPIYITGIYDFDKTFKESERNININSRIINKEERIERLREIELDWRKSKGMPILLRKHLPEECYRILVFCSEVKQVSIFKELVCSWLYESGRKVSGVFSVHHEMANNELKNEFDAFLKETNYNEGLKVMLSVNMLNEGIHITGVDAVILLRSTMSRIIYLQQIGRCLTSTSSKQPVVFDMADNITNTNSVKLLSHYLRSGTRERNNKHGKNDIPFIVYDYAYETRELIKSLSTHVFSKEYVISTVANFYQKEKRLPKQSERNVYYLIRKYESLLREDKRTSQVVVLLDRKRQKETFEYRLKTVSTFVDINKRLPHSSDGCVCNYYAWLKLHYGSDETVKALMEKSKRISTKDGFKKIIDFVNEHNRLPSRSNPSEKKLANIWNRISSKDMKGDPDVENIRMRFNRFMSFQERVRIINDFVSKNQRLPKQSERKLWNIWLYLREKYGNSLIVKKLNEIYSKDKIFESYDDKGNLVKIYKKTSEIAEDLHCHVSSIQRAIKHQKRVKGYYIKSKVL